MRLSTQGGIAEHSRREFYPANDILLASLKLALQLLWKNGAHRAPQHYEHIGAIHVHHP
jgi:hypothetical protein